MPHARWTPILIAAVLLPAAAAAQRPRVDRQKIWPAPTAADWRKPVAVKWQRSFADALAVARATGKPILVCVNMDGEIASEHYAGIVYRRPATKALFAPYVPLVASVYRHTPRDYDERGRRIPCPRFGTVTCGEHIEVEKELYARFFDGKRIAPRHILIEPDGRKGFDVYLTWDVVSVLRAIEEGGKGRKFRPLHRGDLDPVELVASRDVGDRERVERAYLDGDRRTRRRLLEAALQAAGAAPAGLLRLALHDLDPELVRLARRALAKAEDPSLAALVYEALAQTPNGPEREALLAALRRLAQRSVLAARLASVEEAARSGSAAVDLARWRAGLGGGRYPAPADRDSLAARADEAAARAYRPDPQAKLAFAAANAELALEPGSAVPLKLGRGVDFAALLLADAETAAKQALALGARDWRAEAVLALAALRRGSPQEALAHAARAVPAIPPGDTSRLSMKTLETFAYERQREIIRRIRAKKPWPRRWIADLHAAYSVLDAHPFGTDRHVADHVDFLLWLKAYPAAERRLDAGLERFPLSALLHTRQRRRLLRAQGPDGLEAWYAQWLQARGGGRTEALFAAEASIAAAAVHRRRHEPQRALAAYERALERLAGAGRPQARCRARALAGKARVLLELGRLAEAADALLAAFEAAPEAAADRDAANLSAVDTARTLVARLDAAGMGALAELVRGALAGLGSGLLAPPAFERAVRGLPPHPASRPARSRR